jgi:FkbM family methyltransferase
MVIELRKGVRMRLHFGGALSRLIFRGDFEVAERTFLAAYLKPGDVFVDVGANLGLYALLAAHAVGPRGRVHAFEPYAQACDRLRMNVSLNGFQNICVYQIALSDRAGLTSIHLAEPGWDAWNSLAAGSVNESGGCETVVARTWDEFAAANELAGNVTLMKIDVEGWEVPVLRGGRGLLSQPNAPVLQVEFTDAATEGAGFSCQMLYRLLEEYGYRLYRFDHATNRLELDPLQPAYPYTNLFAVKDLATAQARLTISP